MAKVVSMVDEPVAKVAFPGWGDSYLRGGNNFKLKRKDLQVKAKSSRRQSVTIAVFASRGRSYLL